MFILTLRGFKGVMITPFDVIGKLKINRDILDYQGDIVPLNPIMGFPIIKTL